MAENKFTTWLLTAKTPSIRFRTLVDLLGYPAEEPRVVQARQEIMQNGPIPAILSRQSKSGQWEGERSYYTPKYLSSHWSMMLLTELDVVGSDPGFRMGVRHMLAASADGLAKRLDTNTCGFSCFWGNLLRYALHAGKGNGDQVAKVIDYGSLGISVVCPTYGGRRRG